MLNLVRNIMLTVDDINKRRDLDRSKSALFVMNYLKMKKFEVELMHQTIIHVTSVDEDGKSAVVSLNRIGFQRLNPGSDEYSNKGKGLLDIHRSSRDNVYIKIIRPLTKKTDVKDEINEQIRSISKTLDEFKIEHTVRESGTKGVLNIYDIPTTSAEMVRLVLSKNFDEVNYSNKKLIVLYTGDFFLTITQVNLSAGKKTCMIKLHETIGKN